MNTDDVMNIALELAGMTSIPADTEIYHPAERVRRVLLGIDIGENDLLFAKSNGYDLVLAHHPPDKTRFIRVMDRHEALMARNGVALDRASEASLLNKSLYVRWAERLPPDDTRQRLTALAEPLGLGFMNVHSPCDEIGRQALQRLADSIAPPGTVEKLKDAFRMIPEIAASSVDVEMVCGSLAATLGKTVVIHAAGTNGGYHVANALFESGIGTVVYIHLSERQRSLLSKENKGNLIVTGHYGSDSLGINPLVDALEDRGVEVACCNGMIRVKAA